MPSNAYFEALDATRRHHAGGAKTFSGQFTWKQRHRIKDLIDRYNVESILDFGCGRGKQYQNIDEDGRTLEEYWCIKTTKYDPGVVGFDEEPKGKFDLVLCVQVLGSIPRKDILWVVDKLYGFANKAIFVVERITKDGPRKKIYVEIQDEMPYNLSGHDWINLVQRKFVQGVCNTIPPMTTKPLVHLLLKNSEFGFGWNETIL